MRRADDLLFVLLVCSCLCSPAAGAPQYLDATAAVKLNFNTAYGPPFAGLTTTGQIMQTNMGNGAAVGDYDNDGDLDVYLLGMLGHPNVLYRNDLDLGVEWFTEVTAGVEDTGMSRVAHFADLDNDGWLDLLVVNDDDGSDDYPPSRIYRNDGGSFTDVTAGSGFRPVGFLRCGATLGDYDNDGLLDVYVTVWTYATAGGVPRFAGSNRLYRNLGNFQFQDVTGEVNLTGLDIDSYSAVFADFEDDDYPDLFVAVDHESDEFYVNHGGYFSNWTQQTDMTHVGNDMGVAVSDLDNDGDLDVYATNITDPDFFFGTAPPGNALHINQRAGTGQLLFVDEAGARGVKDTYWGWGTEFTDAENDGDLDIVAVNGFDYFITLAGVPSSTLVGSPTVFFSNDGTANFTRLTGVGLDTGWDSRGLVAFDYDRDGDEDLLLTNVDQPVAFYENVSTSQGHWLGVALQQVPGNNRNGIGATLRATVGATTYRRDILAGDSYLVGGPPEAYFGLGGAATVDELVVEWTDGLQSSYPNVAADQLLTLIQPFVDADSDGVHDGHDCDPDDNTAWALPSRIEDLMLQGTATTALSWSTPASPGASVWTFDVLRGTQPGPGSSTCLFPGLGTPGASDADLPSDIYYYLVRTNTPCGSEAGANSNGVDRITPACP